MSLAVASARQGQAARVGRHRFATDLSLRQIEDLLGLLLPAVEAPVQSTVGRWVHEASGRAGEVLKALDPASAERVTTLALDEVFLGGDRPWSGSSHRA